MSKDYSGNKMVGKCEPRRACKVNPKGGHAKPKSSPSPTRKASNKQY